MSERNYLGLLAACAALVACSHDPAARGPGAIGTSRAALAVAVSKPFQVEAYPALVGGGAVGSTRLACGAASCLAVSGIMLNNVWPVVSATPVSTSGTVATPPGLLSQANIGVQAGVVAQGSAFVAFWIDGDSSAVVRNRAARVSATGQVLADLSSSMPAPLLQSAYASGTTILLITTSGNGATTQAEVVNGSALPCSPPMARRWS